MGAMNRLAKFGVGVVIGGAVGALAAVVLAPRSGSDLQRKIDARCGVS